MFFTEVWVVVIFPTLLIIMSIPSSLESELATVCQEKESLTQQLLNTIKQKVALSQELDAWQVWLRVQCVRVFVFLILSNMFLMLQEDMRLVINQQVLQREEERKREKEREKENAGLHRSKSLRVRGEGGKGFFSFFKDKWGEAKAAVV